MNRTVFATSVLLAFSTVSFAIAGTVSKTMPVNATLVNGSTVSAYLVHGEIVTRVKDNGAPAPAGAYGMPPIVQVSFDTKSSSYTVKRVTWDKIHHQLTIDF